MPIYLYEQIEFILTDRVIFPTEASTAEKRALMAKSDGYWQTQLRSVNKYGELKVSQNCIWLAKSRIIPQECSVMLNYRSKIVRDEFETFNDHCDEFYVNSLFDRSIYRLICTHRGYPYLCT